MSAIISTRIALMDLQGRECACGEPKAQRMSHCRRCYLKLPIPMRQDLYKRMGQGYEEAYTASLQFLGLESPNGKRLASLLETQSAVESGFGGVLANGNVVDRRKHPEAIPLAKNRHLGIPAPQAIGESEAGK